jgi:PTS system galactitol-specific IIB component
MVELVVACGGGIFTTTVVTEKIKDMMKKNNIPVKVTPNKITEIAGITGADLIVVTGKTTATNKTGIPVIIGMPLFTGVGEAEFTEKFIAQVREIGERKNNE